MSRSRVQPSLKMAEGLQKQERAMQTKGINHLAPVCRDMAETVASYAGALGMPLVKTVALPDVAPEPAQSASLPGID